MWLGFFSEKKEMGETKKKKKEDRLYREKIIYRKYCRNSVKKTGNDIWQSIMLA